MLELHGSVLEACQHWTRGGGGPALHNDVIIEPLRGP